MRTKTKKQRRGLYARLLEAEKKLERMESANAQFARLFNEQAKTAGLLLQIMNGTAATVEMK